MKNLILLLFFLSFGSSTFAQGINYSLRGKYVRPVKKEALAKANLISDFIDGYPTDWIKDYISTEIATTNEAINLSAKGKSIVLNENQKSVLNSTNLATDIVINVLYKSKNSATDEDVNREMVVKMTIIPEVEAQFIGGSEQKKLYFKENLMDKILNLSEKASGKIVFTINEAGEASDLQITTSTGDEKIDKTMLESIQKMPLWKPAENIEGKKVKQLFELSISGGEGC